MDERSRKILDSFPQRTSRSRLAPYRELIHQLRRRRRTYREIAHILAESCQCKVSISTLHDFVRIRSRAKGERLQPLTASPVESTRSSSAETPVIRIMAKLEEEGRMSPQDVQQRIAALKQRPAPAEKENSAFQYNPNEPLHLPQNTGKDGEAN